MGVASIVLSMIVNAYATGLIAFEIIKVYRNVKPTLETSKSLGSYGGMKYRNVISIVIESGMVLFCVQLVRVVLLVRFEITGSEIYINALEIVIGIHEILNVSSIIISVIATS
jgi:hypothetical protein